MEWTDRLSIVGVTFHLKIPEIALKSCFVSLFRIPKLWNTVFHSHDQGCGSRSGRIRCLCMDPDPDPDPVFKFLWIRNPDPVFKFLWIRIRIRFSNYLDPDLDPVSAKILKNCRKVSKSDLSEENLKFMKL